MCLKIYWDDSTGYCAVTCKKGKSRFTSLMGRLVHPACDLLKCFYSAILTKWTPIRILTFFWCFLKYIADQSCKQNVRKRIIAVFKLLRFNWKSNYLKKDKIWLFKSKFYLSTRFLFYYFKWKIKKKNSNQLLLGCH